MKVHATISSELDNDPELAGNTYLKDCTDEQILAEIARRGLDIHHNVTQDLVKQTYRFEKQLGEGASGEVFLVSHKKSGEKFACKIIKKNDSMNDAESMGTEIEIMKRVRHQHIVALYELYESSTCMWLILELVDGGDLNYFISSHRNYSEMVIAHHFRQILQGLHYLHAQGIVHRDMKLDNILIKGDHEYGEVKIADFGLSALIRHENRSYDRNYSTKRKEFSGLVDMWGTACYFAPEVIDKRYGPQADMWSAGCILYEMLCGEHPFEAESDDELYSKIQHARFSLEGKAWDAVSDNAKDLLRKILVVSPISRLSATEAMSHPWIQAEADLHTSNVAFHAQEAAKEKVGSKPLKKGLFSGWSFSGN